MAQRLQEYVMPFRYPHVTLVSFSLEVRHTGLTEVMIIDRSTQSLSPPDRAWHRTMSAKFAIEQPAQGAPNSDIGTKPTCPLSWLMSVAGGRTEATLRGRQGSF